MTHSPPPKRQNLVCVVDDDPVLNITLCAMLRQHSCEALSFGSADEFLAWFREGGRQCDLIISDIHMPGSSGYDLCREVRQASGAVRIPIILVTGTDPATEKPIGIETGADDFIRKPVDKRTLLAKIDSLLNIHAADLRQNTKVERLTQFLSPSVARILSSDVAEGLLKPHRAEVSILFIDLRRFTTFVQNVEPEEVLEVLGRYYTAVGNAALQHSGTLGHLAGDGIMVFFNDPEPTERHQEEATRAALEIRDALVVEKASWADRGYDIDFGIGLAHGYATLGGIGFDRFWQYSVIGPATNLAARLCQAADQGQIIVSKRFLSSLRPGIFEARALGTLELKGIEKPVEAFDIVSMRQPP